MRTLNQFLLRLKHWQLFLSMVCAIALVGYPLHMLGQRTLHWTMAFKDSPAVGFVILLCWGIWLDAVLASGGNSRARAISPALLIILFGCSLWLKASPYGMLIFLPAIAFIALVMVPVAKAIHSIERRRASPIMVFVDTLLVGCFFPFGVWVLQPRLNAAIVNGAAD